MNPSWQWSGDRGEGVRDLNQSFQGLRSQAPGHSLVTEIPRTEGNFWNILSNVLSRPEGEGSIVRPFGFSDSQTLL